MTLINTFKLADFTYKAKDLKQQIQERGWDVFAEQRAYMVEVFASKLTVDPDTGESRRVLTPNYLQDLEKSGESLEAALLDVLQSVTDYEAQFSV